MGYLISIFENILHLDVTLATIVSNYGFLVYLILFLIIFCETGLVVTPFLPGDSLLFAAGAIASTGALKLYLLLPLLFIAAILGDALNYWIGHSINVRYRSASFFNKDYFNRTVQFYRKHGGKTVVLARFVPIIRTFAPFVAGVTRMPYKNFTIYNIIGSFIWISLFMLGGYLFGNIPLVQENFSLVILMIIVLSIIPMVIEWIKISSRNN